MAFYAYGHSSPINTVAHGALILDRVTTNVGKAYDTDTGVFTVPKSGLYDFQVTLQWSRLHRTQNRLFTDGVILMTF